MSVSLGLHHIVNGSSTLWGARMVEKISAMRATDIVNTLCSMIGASGVLIGGLLVLTGQFSGGAITASKLTSLESQVGAVANQVTKLQERFDTGPRSDQIIQLNGDLSRLAGRLDATVTELQDTRRQLSRAAAEIEQIKEASRQLNRR